MTDTRTRIYRSRDDRMVAGVAGGLARYLGVDPVIVRLAFVALTFAAAGVLIYIVAWIIIPEEPAGSSEAGQASAEPTRTDAGQGARLLFGAALIAIGGMMLLDWAIPSLDRFFWPTMLIVLGGAFLVLGARR